MSNPINDGGPAFPNPALANEGFQPRYDLTGLTKREIFAMVAMQGLISSNATYSGKIDRSALARDAVAQADALMAALERVQS